MTNQNDLQDMRKSADPLDRIKVLEAEVAALHSLILLLANQIAASKPVTGQAAKNLVIQVARDLSKLPSSRTYADQTAKFLAGQALAELGDDLAK